MFGYRCNECGEVFRWLMTGKHNSVIYEECIICSSQDLDDILICPRCQQTELPNERNACFGCAPITPEEQVIENQECKELISI